MPGNSGAKLIVIDSRLNPIAYKADIFAQPMTATDGLWPGGCAGI